MTMTRQSPMGRLGIALAGLVVCGAALTGCSSKSAIRQGGPLAGDIDPSSHLIQCVPVPARGLIVVDGFNTIPNNGQQVAVIDRVALVDPKNLRQLEAWVVPTRVLYGDWIGYPPNGGHHTPTAGFDWPARQNAVGARIGQAAPARPNMNLLVAAQMSDTSEASEQGIDVWYHVGNQRYHLRTNVTMLDRLHC